MLNVFLMKNLCFYFLFSCLYWVTKATRVKALKTKYIRVLKGEEIPDILGMRISNV